MMTVSGTTNSVNAGLANLSPSTAESTEIAGVITEVTEKHRGADDADDENKSGAPAERACRQRSERKRAALPVIVSAQQDQNVLERHRYDQRPDDERKHAKHDATGNDVVSTGRDCRLAKGVKRTCPDVAIDNADTAECQGQEPWRRVMPYLRGRRSLVRAITH